MKNEPSASEAAQVLSRLGASKGGRARAEKLSPERRQEIARRAGQARWAKSARKDDGPAGEPEGHHGNAALLGKRVRITLDENVVTEGVLLGFGDGGDFELQQDDGFVYHAWPMLRIEKVERQ